MAYKILDFIKNNIVKSVSQTEDELCLSLLDFFVKTHPKILLSYFNSENYVLFENTNNVADHNIEEIKLIHLISVFNEDCIYNDILNGFFSSYDISSEYIKEHKITENPILSHEQLLNIVNNYVLKTTSKDKRNQFEKNIDLIKSKYPNENIKNSKNSEDSKNKLNKKIIDPILDTNKNENIIELYNSIFLEALLANPELSFTSLYDFATQNPQLKEALIHLPFPLYFITNHELCYMLNSEHSFYAVRQIIKSLKFNNSKLVYNVSNAIDYCRRNLNINVLAYQLSRTLSDLHLSFSNITQIIDSNLSQTAIDNHIKNGFYNQPKSIFSEAYPDEDKIRRKIKINSKTFSKNNKIILTAVSLTLDLYLLYSSSTIVNISNFYVLAFICSLKSFNGFLKFERKHPLQNSTTNVLSPNFSKEEYNNFFNHIANIHYEICAKLPSRHESFIKEQTNHYGLPYYKFAQDIDSPIINDYMHDNLPQEVRIDLRYNYNNAKKN